MPCNVQKPRDSLPCSQQPALVPNLIYTRCPESKDKNAIKLFKNI
jgi:hypothetical protein